MRQPTQDTLAGRIQPSQYDTVLPPDARAEMFKPKRPAILHRPVHRPVHQPIYQPPERPGILKWAGGFALAAIILTGVIGHYLGTVKTPATTRESAPVVQPTPALEKLAGEPLATPQPAIQPPVPPPPLSLVPSTPLPSTSLPPAQPASPEPEQPALKATLVKLPPPRATLVRAPKGPSPRAELAGDHPLNELGVWQFLMRMPYDESIEVHGVLKGRLGSEEFLPQSGNSIGDTWIVNSVPWVWITVPGTTVPTWVDP
jgi:hypothetical protein